MIEQQIIQGEPAVVMYMNDRMEPVDKNKATLIKVSFEQSKRVLFLTPRAAPTGQERLVRTGMKMWG